METPNKKLGEATGLYRSNQVAAFDQLERQAALAARVNKCVDRTFAAIGASSMTLEIVYSKLYTTKGVERSQIANKPEEFIEVIGEIYGEAGTVVFEGLLGREIRREFGLPARLEEAGRPRTVSELLRLIAYASSESAGNP